MSFPINIQCFVELFHHFKHYRTSLETMFIKKLTIRVVNRQLFFIQGLNHSIYVRLPRLCWPYRGGILHLVKDEETGNMERHDGIMEKIELEIGMIFLCLNQLARGIIQTKFVGKQTPILAPNPIKLSKM